jgi:Helix-turn-helix domain
VVQEVQQLVNNSLALTIPSAAAELDLTEKALRQLVWRKKIKVRRLGKRVIILRSELERFLNDLPSE